MMTRKKGTPPAARRVGRSGARGDGIVGNDDGSNGRDEEIPNAPQLLAPVHAKIEALSQALEEVFGALDEFAQEGHRCAARARAENDTQRALQIDREVSDRSAAQEPRFRHDATQIVNAVLLACGTGYTGHVAYAASAVRARASREWVRRCAAWIAEANKLPEEWLPRLQELLVEGLSLIDPRAKALTGAQVQAAWSIGASDILKMASMLAGHCGAFDCRDYNDARARFRKLQKEESDETR